MTKLPDLSPKICFTATGFLVKDNAVLLVKHKKLGIWLAPGGHMEEDELPHIAAEREFWEETGIKVKALSTLPLMENSDHASYFPVPFAVNDHWINKDFYERRLQSDTPEKRITDTVWKLGCEKHVSFLYLVKAEGSTEFEQNLEETDGIAWFTLKDLDALETLPAIKQEITWALTQEASK